MAVPYSLSLIKHTACSHPFFPTFVLDVERVVDGGVCEDLGRVLAVGAVRRQTQPQRDHRVKRLGGGRGGGGRLRLAGDHVDLESTRGAVLK